MNLNNLILIFFLIIFGVLFYNYFLLILNKLNSKLLIDDQFNKPQAFHELPISAGGGAGIFISLLIVLFYLFSQDIIFIEYLSFCTLFFLLGFVEDINAKISPENRLVLMIIFLLVLVISNDFYVEGTGIEILNNWLEKSKIFSQIFICLCFLFVVNGANLIDGYNGLLSFHSLIILVNLFIINFLSQNNDLANLLFFMILILTIFLKFNFPKAKVFLGDSGSYLLGAFIAISAIKTSIANPTISPFYFCILLFYLFFEVFFSFFRKLIKEKTSPLRPDKKHLHMLLYKLLIKKNNDKLKSNYYVSLIINLIYLVFITPGILMMKNGLFCKYYSVIFFIAYIFCYGLLSKKIK